MTKYWTHRWPCRFQIYDRTESECFMKNGNEKIHRRVQNNNERNLKIGTIIMTFFIVFDLITNL